METTQQAVSPLAIGIRYGLLIAVVGIILDFLTRIVGFSFLTYGIVVGSIGLLVGVIGIVLAHKAFRQDNRGLMSYGQGVLIAVIALLISGLFSSVFNYIYVNYVDPDFIGHMKDGMNEFMERNHVPEDQIAQSTAKFDAMNPTPLMVLVNGVKNGLIGGVLLGVIISIFTKRSHPEFE